ncbi:hypothetical protein AAL_08234 [Moelleriella libera RCEF 2490]|uniref:Uncharacterized protein n=1 Tax=Moelleriella libera RCEF 2490 TaxID=1081109 RepID=A0A162I2U3_9HYPO|nr:hypothetical protein AAL_08234 [Moelleriella libera RCEF 2490]
MERTRPHAESNDFFDHSSIEEQLPYTTAQVRLTFMLEQDRRIPRHVRQQRCRDFQARAAGQHHRHQPATPSPLTQPAWDQHTVCTPTRSRQGLPTGTSGDTIDQGEHVCPIFLHGLNEGPNLLHPPGLERVAPEEWARHYINETRHSVQEVSPIEETWRSEDAPYQGQDQRRGPLVVPPPPGAPPPPPPDLPHMTVPSRLYEGLYSEDPPTYPMAPVEAFARIGAAMERSRTPRQGTSQNMDHSVLLRESRRDDQHDNETCRSQHYKAQREFLRRDPSQARDRRPETERAVHQCAVL